MNKKILLFISALGFIASASYALAGPADDVCKNGCSASCTPTHCTVSNDKGESYTWPRKKRTA